MEFYREFVKPDLDDIRANMATKSDLQAIRAEMATKSDLQAVERGVQAELQAIRREMVTWPVLIRFHEDVIRPAIDDVRSRLADLAELAKRHALFAHIDRLDRVLMCRTEVESRRG